ncbi:DoxX family protein [Flavitalea sp. BT771]|uniref:DoxX family protein n=1 Tax=Flavitalea sp. BT771 TaxID=3063329 RepID=UPI0026E35AA5|nr:DoxX family protein [Flavitalea sp. BT771]MDO6432620.1 DoxX family protein [Flavitalea sp. BT771]MDV6222104.1 DoxX family protein [Flavitalea sp. BT771]
MPTEQKISKKINIILWIAQTLLAAVFIWAGFMKIFLPSNLPFPWIRDNANLALITGVVDLLAGIGIMLPALIRIKPELTAYAAYGTIVLMIAASIFHISRGEAKDIGVNIFVIVLAAFIAWGRQKKAPLKPK